MSPKRAARAEKFRKLGQAISQFNDLDYHTGKASHFAFKRYDKRNREDKPEGKGTEIPYGPRFNTPQWERTVKRD